MLQTANGTNETVVCVRSALRHAVTPCALLCVCVHILKAGCVVLPGAERFYEARRSFNAVFLLAKADITRETKWNSGTVDWLWTLCVVGSVCCREFVIIFSENSKSEILSSRD